MRENRKHTIIGDKQKKTNWHEVIGSNRANAEIRLLKLVYLIETTKGSCAMKFLSTKLEVEKLRENMEQLTPLQETNVQIALKNIGKVRFVPLF